MFTGFEKLSLLSGLLDSSPPVKKAIMHGRTLLDLNINVNFQSRFAAGG